ncbi:MAG TPA: acyloxyacyl hydrolase [Vicinamibacterales bacterium]|nr:acyloxyacyl hydrolase [Vicinamibacterales bacterium]
MCTAIVCAACASGSVAHAQRPSDPAPAADPFAKRGWHLELGGHGAVEAWNYNISREDLLALVPGLTYGLREGLQLTASWPMYFVSQQGPDAYLVGAAFGVRGRIYRRKHVNVFLEIKVGVSDTDTYVPPRGTRFNYLAFGGAGVTIRMRRGLHALAGVEWMHLSNGGFAGRSRNPDIEAIGPRLGVLIAF